MEKSSRTGLAWRRVGLRRILGGKMVADTGLEHLLMHANRVESPGRLGRAVKAVISERLARRLVTIIATLGVTIVSLLAIYTYSALSSHEDRSRLRHMDSLLRLASLGLDGMAGRQDSIRAPVADDLKRILPEWALREQRCFVIVNADGFIQAIAGSVPPGLALSEGAALLPRLRGLAQAMSGDDNPHGEPHAISLPVRGHHVLVAARPLSGWPGGILLLQPAHGSSGWSATTLALFGGLLGLTVILIILLMLYNWQADRAMEDNSDHLNFINRLEAALELGRCGLWDWDVARGRIYLTRSMRRLLGLPLADGYLDLADFLLLQHPEEPPIDDLLEQQLQTGEKTFEQELRLRNQQDGTWLWLKLRGALPADDSRAPHLLGIAIDITAQKRAAADKRDAELLLDQAIESISESFALWDAGMRLVKCNSKFREFHGLPREACRPGRSYADIMSEAGCRCRKREFRHVLESAGGRETVMEMELEDERWLQISERQMEWGGSVSVGTDITELKRKQLELESSRQELEQTVHALEQTQAEIEHKNIRLRRLARRYQQEKERAERALRTKSQILANVSHELFTPLNHMVVSAEILQMGQKGELTSEQRTYIRQILQAGGEMRRKIHDIMEYAELSTESRELRPAAFRPAELLAEVTEAHAARAEEKGIALHWRAAEGLVAQADAQSLQQALRQLVSNAVTFTEKGEVLVSAEVRKEDGALLLSVRDTGVGIPEELLSRIGQPFERAGSAYNSHKGGSGIGLAIARAVAEMHGGKLEIDSAPGKGTLVRLVIPQAQAQMAPRRDAGDASDESGGVRLPAE